MQPSRTPGASPFNRVSIVRRRPFALLCALLALACAYCDRTVGGNLTNVATPNPDGTACNNDVECASFSCSPSSGVCVAPASGLVEIDGLCNDGQTCVGDASCQGGICVANSMACSPDGKACVVDNDCCKFDCENSACGGTSTGTGASGTGGSGPGCAALGAQCDVDSDCCDGNGCDTTVFTCSDTCALQGGNCDEDSDCCSGTCETDDNTCI